MIVMEAAGDPRPQDPRAAVGHTTMQPPHISTPRQALRHVVQAAAWEPREHGSFFQGPGAVDHLAVLGTYCRAPIVGVYA